MSLEKLFAQTTPEAPSAPMRETFIAPTLLPVCCVCGLIRDDTRFSPGRELWVTQRTYRETHGVNPDRARSHTHLLSEMFHEGPGDSEAVLQGDWNVAMILLAGSPDIDASSPVLPDASHRTADREKGPCNTGIDSAW